VLVSGLFVFPLLAAAEAEIPNAIIYNASLGPVFFLHDKHLEITSNNCDLCHHLKEAERKKACRDCHKKKADMVEGDPISFFDVKMNFCRGCHTKARAASQKSPAPTACSECHQVKSIDWSK
jgi:hypothetical protein